MEGGEGPGNCAQWGRVPCYGFSPTMKCRDPFLGARQCLAPASPTQASHTYPKALFFLCGPRGELFSEFWEPNTHKKGFEILGPHSILEARFVSQTLGSPWREAEEGRDRVTGACQGPLSPGSGLPATSKALRSSPLIPETWHLLESLVD